MRIFGRLCVCVCGKHSIEESTLMCTPTNPSDSSWAATVHSSFRSRYCKCRKFFIEYLPTTNTWHFGDPQINQPPPTMDRNASALVILNGGNDAITYRLNDLKECFANAINQMSCMHSPLISIVRRRYISAIHIHRNKKNYSRARVCKEFYCFSWFAPKRNEIPWERNENYFHLWIRIARATINDIGKGFTAVNLSVDKAVYILLKILTNSTSSHVQTMEFLFGSMKMRLFGCFFFVVFGHFMYEYLIK